MKLHRRKSLVFGFSLIELLVTVSIIAILGAIGIAVFSGSQSSARDGRRKGDIDAIAKALEMKRIPGEQYYVAISDSDFAGSKGVLPTNSADGSATYCIATVTSGRPPADPSAWVNTNSCPTGYATFSASTAFTSVVAWKVCARLEASTTTSLKTYCQSSAQ